MTLFAPVAPLEILRELDKAQLLGSYHLVIAPIVLSRKDEYARFFGERKDRDMLVILDNGVIEQQYPMSPHDLAEAAKIVGASVVVLPDTIDDVKMTMKQVRHALSTFRVYDRTTLTMGVVQGTTLEECLVCADSHVKAGVDWLAVPRGLTANLLTRVPLVEHLAKLHGKPMHVLGFSNNVEDDILSAVASTYVVGIDAATPTWHQSWLPLHPPSDPAVSLGWGRRPPEYWTHPDIQTAEHSGLHNVETVRRWLRDAQAARIAKAELAARPGLRTPPLSS